MEKRKPKKLLASTKSPLIDALVNQRFVFSSKEDALKKMEQLNERFVRSSLTESVADDCSVLWIKYFQVSKEDKEQGCVGNFAVIQPDMTPDGKYTLNARKIPIDPQKHPQRKRKKSKHPDWGYWVLRRVKKNWKYDSIDEAYNDLMTLAEDFPEVSIPGQNKLYTIIYRKTDDDSLPLFRVVLEVDALPEGGFTITCKENTFKRENKKPKTEAPTTENAETAPENLGKFTSMVAVKRNKRKNIADIRKEQPTDGENNTE